MRLLNAFSLKKMVAKAVQKCKLILMKFNDSDNITLAIGNTFFS